MITSTREHHQDASLSFQGVPVLVLGGTGFIGQWVVRALAARGADVWVAARNADAAEARLAADETQAHVIHADLTQAGSVRDAIGTAGPAIVFNLAVYGVDHSEREESSMSAVNEAIVPDLCAQLVDTPAQGWRGLRLVHVGSALEYGAIGGSLREDSTPAPTTGYGRTKLAATRNIERVAAATGLRAVTARLFTVYGFGEHPGRLLPSLMALAGTDRQLKLSAGLQRRDFTYVEDVADGLLRLATAPVPAGAVVNLATGRLTTVREFAEIAAGILSIDRSALAFGALPMRTEEMWHDEIDITRLRELTSWTPSTTIADGIRRSWEWQHVQR